MGAVARAYAERIGDRKLQYITPIANTPSIMQYGILSHHGASQLAHIDISLGDVQRKRSKKEVVVGRTQLHQYANLYFDARNPMMYRRRSERSSLCVLSVSYDVLDIASTVVADRNAASDYARFFSPMAALDALDFASVFARDWTDPCAPVFYEKRSKKCAEVLVLDCVPPNLIVDACVLCEASAEQLSGKIGAGSGFCVKIDPDLFFE